MPKDIALVLSADAWNMVDEKTGEAMSGVSIWFLTEYRDQSHATQVGYKPAKVGGSPEILEKLRTLQLPAQCEMHYGAKPGAAGKATLILNDITYVKSVDVFGSAATSDKKAK
jgi:hypothetical protein